jgi:hypothetical protein
LVRELDGHQRAGLVAAYESAGSGAGRLAFGAEQEGLTALGDPLMTPVESKDAFVGSDEPLTMKQMLNVDSAAEAAGGEQALVIPVAQAAVAVIVNPPANCTVTHMTNAETAEGMGC